MPSLWGLGTAKTKPRGGLAHEKLIDENVVGVRGFLFSGVFNSGHLKNAFRAVHILFM